MLIVCCWWLVLLWACPPLVCHSPMGSVFCLLQIRAGLCKGCFFQVWNLLLLWRMWCLSIDRLAHCLCQRRMTCRCLFLVLSLLAQFFPVPLNILVHITYDILVFIWLFCIPLALLFFRLKMHLSFQLGIFMGTCLVAFYQRIRTWLLGIHCWFWFFVQAGCIIMFLLFFLGKVT